MIISSRPPASVGARRRLGAALGSLLLLSGIQAEGAKGPVDVATDNLPPASAPLSAITKPALDDDPVPVDSKKQRRKRKDERGKRQTKALQERRDYPVPPVSYRPSFPPIGK